MELLSRGDEDAASGRECEGLAILDPATCRGASARLPAFAKPETPFPLDDTTTFNYPGIEPTLNQTVILCGMKDDDDIAGCLSSTANPHADAAAGLSGDVAYAALPSVADGAPGLQRRAPAPAPADAAAAYQAALLSVGINYKSAETLYDPRSYTAGYAAEPLRAIANGAARTAAGFPFGLLARGGSGGGASCSLVPVSYAPVAEDYENVPPYAVTAAAAFCRAGGAADAPHFAHHEPKARAAGGARSRELETWRSHEDACRQLLPFPQGDGEAADLNRKLGAAELEIRTLRDSLVKVQNDHSAQLKKMEDKIRNRDKHMESLKKRCQKSSEERDEKERRLQSVERYLSALPTVEDHQRDLLQRKELETLKSSLQYRVEALETRLRDKDREILDHKAAEEELTATVQSLQQRLESVLPPRGAPRELDAMQLRQENQNAKKIINILKKKLEALAEEKGEKIRLLEERAAQEEEENQALRGALAERDGGLHALQGAVKELAAQNQELLDGHLRLKEELRESANPPCELLSAAHDELHAQLRLCFGELRALCRVVCQRLHGHDPNLSLLLGIPGVMHDDEGDDDGTAPLTATLDAVRRLRAEVDEARAVVSERYAEHVGENCAVQ